MTRPLLTVISISRSMILPFLWQVSKGVNPLVDKFIFMLQQWTPVKSPSSDCFEYLSEASIEPQRLKYTGVNTVQPKLQISALGPK